MTTGHGGYVCATTRVKSSMPLSISFWKHWRETSMPFFLLLMGFPGSSHCENQHIELGRPLARSNRDILMFSFIYLIDLVTINIGQQEVSFDEMHLILPSKIAIFKGSLSHCTEFYLCITEIWIWIGALLIFLAQLWSCLWVYRLQRRSKHF